jgi:hypothetical protein
MSKEILLCRRSSAHQERKDQHFLLEPVRQWPHDPRPPDSAALDRVLQVLWAQCWPHVRIFALADHSQANLVTLVKHGVGILAVSVNYVIPGSNVVGASTAIGSSGE